MDYHSEDPLIQTTFQRYFLLAMTVFAALVADTGYAQKVPRGHIMQKTVAALTGMAAEDVLSAKQIADIESGRTSFEELAEMVRPNKNFALHYAKFWTERFQIFDLVEWADNLNLDRPGCVNDRPCNFMEEVSRYYNEDRSDRRRLQYSNGVCRDDISDDDMSGEFAFRMLGRLASSHEDYRMVVDPRLDGNCFGRTALVKPWWASNPADYIRVGSKVSEYCGGEDLPECMPEVSTSSINEQGHYAYDSGLRYGFTMQPGMMIAMQTQDQEPWGSALTTDKVPVNGALADFLHRFNHSDTEGSLQFFKFPGAYPNIKTNSTFTKANPQGTNDWKWVKQGLASGVMSTFAFHRVTDGRRAKFNRIYNSMLCLEFQAFPDTIPDPTDNNPDLTKRSGCGDCHTTIEPAARYFANWPEVGNNAASFFSQADPAVKGSYLNQTGAGTPALAQTLKDSIPFHSCGVQRAFEFVMGRDMSQEEKGRVTPHLLEVYRKNKNRIWPVIKHVVTSAYFTEGK
jgi:hypothetical protein